MAPFAFNPFTGSLDYYQSANPVVYNPLSRTLSSNLTVATGCTYFQHNLVLAAGVTLTLSGTAELLNL